MTGARRDGEQAGRMRTLLTGFGPFGTVTDNPTERLARHFAAADVPGHDLTTRVLPVSFARAPELMRRALQTGAQDGQPFENVVMLGVATGAKRWRVEQAGRNYDDPRLPDCDGLALPPRRIAPEFPEALPVSFPVETLVAALEAAGVPAVPSPSAGAYLCNHILFVTLCELQRMGSAARAGFLHVPADAQTFRAGITTAPQFPFAQHVLAVETVLKSLANPLEAAVPASTFAPVSAGDPT